MKISFPNSSPVTLLTRKRGGHTKLVVLAVLDLVRGSQRAAYRRPAAIARKTKVHWTKVHYRADSFGPSVGYDRYLRD
jgi:hypothetical protein